MRCLLLACWIHESRARWRIWLNLLCCDHTTFPCLSSALSLQKSPSWDTLGTVWRVCGAEGWPTLEEGWWMQEHRGGLECSKISNSEPGWTGEMLAPSDSGGHPGHHLQWHRQEIFSFFFGSSVHKVEWILLFNSIHTTFTCPYRACLWLSFFFFLLCPLC